MLDGVMLLWFLLTAISLLYVVIVVPRRNHRSSSGVHNTHGVHGATGRGNRGQGRMRAVNYRTASVIA